MIDTELEVVGLVLGLLCLVIGLGAAFNRSGERTGVMATGFLMLGVCFVAISFTGWKWLVAGMVLGGVLILVGQVVAIVMDDRD